MIKSELDAQIEALMTEKAEKLQSISAFQADLKLKIDQLQQMVGECDDKAGALESGYESCTMALREDFAATLSAQRGAVEAQVSEAMEKMRADPSLAQQVLDE